MKTFNEWLQINEAKAKDNKTQGTLATKNINEKHDGWTVESIKFSNGKLGVVRYKGKPITDESFREENIVVNDVTPEEKKSIISARGYLDVDACLKLLKTRMSSNPDSVSIKTLDKDYKPVKD